MLIGGAVLRSEVTHASWNFEGGCPRVWCESMNHEHAGKGDGSTRQRFVRLSERSDADQKCPARRFGELSGVAATTRRRRR